MTVLEFLFGRRPATIRPMTHLDLIEAPPEDALWQSVRPRKSNPVQATIVRRDGVVQTPHGAFQVRAGDHYVVRSKQSVSVVRRDIFEKTYQRRWLGGYEKRPNVVYRYFTLPRAVMVMTEEGPQHAGAGDWIMQGVAGELWPVPMDEAEEKYEPADAPASAPAPAPAAEVHEHAMH